MVLIENHHCLLPDSEQRIGIIMRCPQCGAYWRSYMALTGVKVSFKKLGIFEVARLIKMGRIKE